MAKLTVQELNLTGTAPTFTSASSTGDYFDNDGRTSLHIKNGGTASITVTIKAASKCSHGFSHDHSFSVGAGSEMVLGKIDLQRFNNSEGDVTLEYSAVTSVSVAVFKL